MDERRRELAVDLFSLPKNENPVVDGSVDRPVQRRRVILERCFRRKIEIDLLDVRERRSKVGNGLGLHSPDGEERERRRWGAHACLTARRYRRR